jgi:hypothetical protein
VTTSLFSTHFFIPKMRAAVVLVLVLAAIVAEARINEVWTKEQRAAKGIKSNFETLEQVRARTGLSATDVPQAFSWCEHPTLGNMCTVNRYAEVFIVICAGGDDAFGAL